MNKHSKKSVLKTLMQADVSSVATHEGVKIRLRQMHYAPNEDLSLYFATMKGDPKTVQITNDPSITILILERSGDMQTWSETEIRGQMKAILSVKEKALASKKLYSRSPIVKQLVDTKSDHILEWLKLKPEHVKHRVFGEIVQGVPPTIWEFNASKTTNFKEDLLKAWKNVQLWFRATRSLFLSATILPAIAGIAISVHDGYSLGHIIALVTVIGTMLIHAGANLLNDYFDHLGGSDEINQDFAASFSGGSRIIQLGLIAPHNILLTGSTFILTGALIGLYLAWVAGIWVLALGILGIGIATLYSIPKRGLVSVGLGELSIGIAFGPLVALGAYYVQSSSLSWYPVIASIPIGLLIAMVLLMNELPDMKADKAVSKRTLAVRLGPIMSLRLYNLMGTFSFALLGFFVWKQLLPFPTILAFAGMPFWIWSSLLARRYVNEPKKMAAACASTVAAHLIVGIGLTAGFCISFKGSYATAVIGSSIVAVLALWLWRYILKTKHAYESAEATFAQK